MALTFHTGSIFDAPEDHALVIPVNTKGACGAGLAKKAREYRGWEAGYKTWLKAKRRYGGSVGAFLTQDFAWLVAATKEDWREPSRIEWVDQCLWRLAQMGPSPIAIPKLGCGKGQLDWEIDVRPRVYAYAVQAKADWLVYE